MRDSCKGARQSEVLSASILDFDSVDLVPKQAFFRKTESITYCFHDY
jgi:hypothetical protein